VNETMNRGFILWHSFAVGMVRPASGGAPP
jgi:hypothetical protein